MSRYARSDDNVIDLTSSPGSSSAARQAIELSDDEQPSADPYGLERFRFRGAAVDPHQGPPPSAASSSRAVIPPARPTIFLSSSSEIEEEEEEAVFPPGRRGRARPLRIEEEEEDGWEEEEEVPPTKDKGKGKAKEEPPKPKPRRATATSLLGYGFEKLTSPQKRPPQIIAPTSPRGRKSVRARRLAGAQGPATDSEYEEDDEVAEEESDEEDEDVEGVEWVRVRYKDKQGLADYRNDPIGALKARIESSAAKRHRHLYRKGGMIDKLSKTGRSELVGGLRRNAKAAFEFFRDPQWSDSDKALFLPGFLDHFTMLVSILYVAAMSRTFEKRVLSSVLQLFSIDLKDLVLFLAEPFRLSIGQQSFLLARVQDADADPRDFLRRLDVDKDTSAINYFKEVQPGSTLGGNCHVSSLESRGSYTGETISPPDRETAYKREINNARNLAQKLLAEGLSPSEVKERMEKKFRFFARYALGDPELPRDPAIVLPKDPVFKTYKEMDVPSVYWSPFGVHAAIESLNGIGSGSFGKTARNYAQWKEELEESTLELPFDLSIFEESTLRTPLMRELPIAPSWGKNTEAEQYLTILTAFTDLLGRGIERSLLLTAHPGRYSVTFPSMVSLHGIRFQILGFRGPDDLGRGRIVRLKINSEANLSLVLVPRTQLVSTADSHERHFVFEEQKENIFSSTSFPQVILHKMIDFFFRDDAVQRIFKNMPGDTPKDYASLADKISAAGWAESVALPDDAKSVSALEKSEAATAAAGSAALSASISFLEKQKRAVLLLHSPPGAHFETVRIPLQTSLSKRPADMAAEAVSSFPPWFPCFPPSSEGYALAHGIAQQAPNTPGAPRVSISMTSPHKVYDATGRVIIENLLTTATQGRKSRKGDEIGVGGKQKFLAFLEAVQQGASASFTAEMEEERAYRREGVRKLQHKAREGRKESGKAATKGKGSVTQPEDESEHWEDWDSEEEEEEDEEGDEEEDEEEDEDEDEGKAPSPPGSSSSSSSGGKASSLSTSGEKKRGKAPRAGSRK